MFSYEGVVWVYGLLGRVIRVEKDCTGFYRVILQGLEGVNSMTIGIPSSILVFVVWSFQSFGVFWWGSLRKRGPPDSLEHAVPGLKAWKKIFVRELSLSGHSHSSSSLSIRA